jgi:ribonuclease HI
MQSTHTQSLEVISGIVPLKLRFEFLARKYVVLIQSLEQHPFKKNLENNFQKNDPNNLFHCATWYDDVYVYRKFPFYKTNFEFEHDLKIDTSLSETKNIKENWSSERIRKEVTGRLEDKHALGIYTDASIRHNGSGYAIYCREKEFKKTVKVANDNPTIFTLEALAISRAIKFAQNNCLTDGKILIISDSLSVLEALKNLDYGFKKNYIINEIRKNYTKLQKSNEMEIMWVPSHCGIKGNEMADSLAAEAIESPNETVKYRRHFSEYTKIFKREMTQKWQEKWDASEKGRYCYSILKEVKLKPWFYKTKLKRRHVTLISRIISNHTRCKNSLNQFKIVNSPLCECGKYEDVNHLLFICEKWKENRKNLVKSIKKLGLETIEVRDVIARCLEDKRYDILREIAQYAAKNEMEI